MPSRKTLQRQTNEGGGKTLVRQRHQCLHEAAGLPKKPRRGMTRDAFDGTGSGDTFCSPETLSYLTHQLTSYSHAALLHPFFALRMLS